MLQILAPDGNITDRPAFESLGLNFNDCLEIYRKMLITRLFEEKATHEGHLDNMPLYISPRGQEAAEVASAYALTDQDWIFFYSRSQGAPFTRGVSLETMFKLFYGVLDEAGIKDFLDHRVMLPYILVGAHLTHASGLVWACKILKSNPCAAIAYFGEGATAQDDFNSVLNFAGIYNLPIVLFCENNQKAISTPNNLQTPTKTFAEKASGFGVKSWRIDGNDPFAVLQATRQALELARTESRPGFIEAVTYRLGPHTTKVGDISPVLSEELREAQKREPLARFKKFLIASSQEYFGESWTEEKDDALRGEITDLVKAAAKKAWIGVENFNPEAAIAKSFDLLKKHVVDTHYKDISFQPSSLTAAIPEIIDAASVLDAINLAYFDIMASDNRVITLGQDVGRIGSVFRTVCLPESIVKACFPEKIPDILSKRLPLIKIFGKDRCIDTPLDEIGIVGDAIGLALGGCRPIVEIQFSGFVFEAFGQIIPELAKFFSNSAGLIKMPVVIRLPYGVGRYIEHHRESEIPFFLNSPGLTVVVPSTVQDFYDMLWSAGASDKPVIFFEDKNLYRLLKGRLVRRPFFRPIEEFGIRVARVGEHITLAAYGRLVHSALKAAEIVAEEGISVEVLDLRIISPLDKKTLISSVFKTGKLVVVHEEPQGGDIGGELAACIYESENSFLKLGAPLIRVGPKTYMPSPLAFKVYEPKPENIAEALRKSFSF